MFQRSLNTDLQAELVCKGENVSFTDFVTFAIKMDNLMRQTPRGRNVREIPPVTPTMTQAIPTNTLKLLGEPMEVNLTKLSEIERARRLQLHLCLYCGKPGHRCQRCPHKAQNPIMVNMEHLSLPSNQAFKLPLILKTEELSISLMAMIDSINSHL